MNIVVAMSGGVDSSVAAALLQSQGHQVQGVFMKNWSPLDGQSLSDCPWEQDQADAEAVCVHLGIPFRSINFEREYRSQVVDYLVSEYAAGRTPNPDVLCNKEIKFAAFKEIAHEMGAEAIATGHYVSLTDGHLVRGVDEGKDQSYFLYSLSGEQLEGAMFPVGGMPKSEVRRLATEFGLPTAAKKDSQGICFIGHLNLKDFLAGEIGSMSGELRLLPVFVEGTMWEERAASAAVVGEHKGSAFYTQGEKMGGYLDNRLYSKVRGVTEVPHVYVVGKDAARNTVYVTEDRQDPALNSKVMKLESWYATGDISRVSMVDTMSNFPLAELSVQVRYQQHPIAVASFSRDENGMQVVLAETVWGASAGQSLVVYHGNVVVGGGVLCATN
ncbi:tRNA 2-thiouridine(34) synthase MnmA [soil metagenome]